MMTTPTNDRFTGVLVAAACADALGAGYEFGPPLPAEQDVLMRGQGYFAPGEWTDDTAQMIAIALAAADGYDLRRPSGLDIVARNLVDWYLSPARLKDIGIHSSAVFGQVTQVDDEDLGERLRGIAKEKERRSRGTSGGNGALMRTAPVALALWRDPVQMVAVAALIGGMTHADPLSDQCCQVWCLAIRAALLAQDPSDIEALASAIKDDIRAYLPDVADYWVTVLDEAWGTTPADYFGVKPGNGYCVTTLRAAWGAITSVPVPVVKPGRHLRRAIEAAVRGGDDTDTVACVTGALAGAMWGVSAVPLQWRRRIFGWPHMRDRDLVELADAIRRGRKGDSWPQQGHHPYFPASDTESFAVHPHDREVLLSGVAWATSTKLVGPDGPTAIVSLCRVGHDDLRFPHDQVAPEDRVEVWLIDDASTPNLDLVLDEAADAVRQFRDEGKRVLVHCVAAQSRTPSVAARYSVCHLGIDADQAWSDIRAALPEAWPNAAFVESVRRPWDN